MTDLAQVQRQIQEAAERVSELAVTLTKSVALMRAAIEDVERSLATVRAQGGFPSSTGVPKVDEALLKVSAVQQVVQALAGPVVGVAGALAGTLPKPPTYTGGA